MCIVAGLRRLRPAGQRNVFADVVALFVQTAPPILMQLAAAAAAGDARRLIEASHKLRGISANIGARRVSARCETLETVTRLGSVPQDVTDQIGAIAAEYERAVAALKSYCL